MLRRPGKDGLRKGADVTIVDVLAGTSCADRKCASLSIGVGARRCADSYTFGTQGKY